MSEGAAILCLEELEQARARGATIYAEVVGAGSSNDAYNMITPDPEAAGVSSMMSRALESAGIAPEDVDYVNAHGTGTPLGDFAETKAIKRVFGEHAYKLPISSTKSMVGHLFGGAGALEAMVCVLGIHHGIVPPTINLDDPDPDCDLDYIPHEARTLDIRYALSNAMGLGGHNACVLLGRA
jgi:3-oxoacyl-[acyl-carrier-protein] synthase II